MTKSEALLQKLRLYAASVRPFIKKIFVNDTVASGIVGIVAVLFGVGFIMLPLWLWENVEAFRWLVGLGVLGLLLLLLAEAAPLLLAIAALVYLAKNC